MVIWNGRSDAVAMKTSVLFGFFQSSKPKQLKWQQRHECKQFGWFAPSQELQANRLHGTT